MQLIDLMNKANEGYPDGFLSEYFNSETGEATGWKTGDVLAWFVAVELGETFNSEKSDREQVEEAVRVIQNAINDLQSVIDSLAADAGRWRWCGQLKDIEGEGGMYCPHRKGAFDCIGCPLFKDVRVDAPTGG